MICLGYLFTLLEQINLDCSHSFILSVNIGLLLHKSHSKPMYISLFFTLCQTWILIRKFFEHLWILLPSAFVVQDICSHPILLRVANLKAWWVTGRWTWHCKNVWVTFTISCKEIRSIFEIITIVEFHSLNELGNGRRIDHEKLLTKLMK